jgi:urea transporter
VSGIIILLTTFLYPLHGIFGLLGALFSSAWAYLLGADRQSVRNGLFGFNGVLTGLAMGFLYAPNVPSLVFLLSATLFLTLLTMFLNHVFNRYFGLPSMSMPFNITASLVVLAGAALARLTPALNLPVIDMQIPDMRIPGAAASFLSSFSAILFQPNPLSGFFIAAAIFFCSRIAFTLMAAGFLAACYMHNISGFDMTVIDEKYLGFNYMFSALAIGGVFSVPGVGSLLLGLLGTAVTVIVTAACVIFFPAPLSPLAVPFNITVWLFLYALRIRAYPYQALNVSLSADSAVSPEENLRKHHEILKQWKKPFITISLPFHGRWKVTQGINGRFTHKEDWAFAYDFQAVDFGGMTYKSSGAEPEDYFSFGLPVTAPAAGKIHSLKQDVPDNLIGRTNMEENWGNHVIIEHAAGYYSCLSHLKRGSIKVATGQEVLKGEIIAACGNSGRSPYPHIHLQFQALPRPGSPSIGFEFSNIIAGNEHQTYIPQGIVRENSVVRNMEPAIDYEEFFPYSLNKVWTYRKSPGGSKKTLEFWHSELDFLGNSILVSSPKTSKIYYRLSDGVLSVKAVEGDPATGLALMGGLISEIPFAADDNEMTWTSFDPAACGIPPVIKAVIDVFSLCGFNLMASRRYTARSGKDEITLSIKSSLYLKVVFFTVRLKELPDVEMVFKGGIGLKTLKWNKLDVFGHNEIFSTDAAPPDRQQ